jgi:hypothetical protein
VEFVFISLVLVSILELICLQLRRESMDASPIGAAIWNLIVVLCNWKHFQTPQTKPFEPLGSHISISLFLKPYPSLVFHIEHSLPSPNGILTSLELMCEGH